MLEIVSTFPIVTLSLSLRKVRSRPRTELVPAAQDADELAPVAERDHEFLWCLVSPALAVRAAPPSYYPSSPAAARPS